MRILFLSRWYPYPPDNGSKIRIFGLLRGLCERHDVTLLSFHDPKETLEDPSQPAPAVTRVCRYREFQPGSGRALAGYLSRTPRYLVDTHRPEMETLIRQTVRERDFDLVIASQLSMAAYAASFSAIPAIFEEAELGTYLPSEVHEPSPWTRMRRRLMWIKHRKYMARLLGRFLCCTVVSEVERRLLASAVPGYGRVHVVPNAVDATPIGPADARRATDSLIFTGSLRYAPNRDAMGWFVNEVLPDLRANVPTVRLTITGDAGPLPFAPVPDVILSGRVADVRPLVAASTVSIAPIRLGGGTRLKILEAMAVRTPIVATTKAVEGLDVRHGEHVLIADTALGFADAVRRILRDPGGAQAMAERAWRLCQARYDSRIVATEFLRLIDGLAA